MKKLCTVPITLFCLLIGSSCYIKPVLVETVVALVKAKPISSTVVPCIAIGTVYTFRKQTHTIMPSMLASVDEETKVTR